MIEVPLFIGPTFNGRNEIDLSRIVGQFDTGNDHTVVRRDLLEEFDVALDGEMISLHGVTGSELAPSGLVEIVLLFDNGEQFRLHQHVVVASQGLRCDALLGRDFLQWFDISIRRDGTFVMLN